MNLATYIDHTLLKPDCSQDSIQQLCNEALEFGFYGVCVPPYYVAFARKLLSGAMVRVTTVAGFPIGYVPMETKETTIHQCIESGADEIDIVINVSAVKSSDWDYVKDEIRHLSFITREVGLLHKFIFETGLLEKEEIQRLCTICNGEGVDFVKTSTGFFGRGPNADLITNLRRMLEPEIKIKASGGIRDYPTAMALIKAGADRLGCSASVEIIKSKM